MKWAIIISASVWYFWRLYTLSYNPNLFPDPAYANKIWDKRARNSSYLGAAIVTAVPFLRGNIHSWWVVVLVFVASIFLLTLLQTGLVGLIIIGRARKAMCRWKFGLKSRPPRLAPFVWTYYLTEEEKGRGKAAGETSPTKE
jgi:hypothetical protein